MTLALNIALAALFLSLAVWTIAARDTFAAVAGFIPYGLLMTLVWLQLSAIDVAMTEAAIGAGLTGALLAAFIAPTPDLGGDYLLDYQAPVEQVRKELGLSALPYTVLQSMQLRLIASRHAEGSRRLLDELDRAYEELQAAGEPLQLD